MLFRVFLEIGLEELSLGPITITMKVCSLFVEIILVLHSTPDAPGRLRLQTVRTQACTCASMVSKKLIMIMSRVAHRLSHWKQRFILLT